MSRPVTMTEQALLEAASRVVPQLREWHEKEWWEQAYKDMDSRRMTLDEIVTFLDLMQRKAEDFLNDNPDADRDCAHETTLRELFRKLRDEMGGIA